MKSLRQLGEFGLIEEIKRWSSPRRKVTCGIGDDAAVIGSSKRGRQCLAVDTLVEGVHFRRNARAEHVGWKAMAVNVSDMAAMGAVPEYAVVSLTVPRWINVSYIRKLYAGMVKCGRRHGTDLVGGDTVRGKYLSISVSMLGAAKKSELVYRSGAQRGDYIFVTGQLGGSGEGRHLTFMPRLRESRFLVSCFKPHAMIDVSDGLLADLRQILSASHVGAEVFLEHVPVRLSARRGALQRALGEGEDFELLFTMPPRQSVRLRTMWRRRWATRLSMIGVITGNANRLALKDRGRTVTSHGSVCPGFRHF